MIFAFCFGKPWYVSGTMKLLESAGQEGCYKSVTKILRE